MAECQMCGDEGYDDGEQCADCGDEICIDCAIPREVFNSAGEVVRLDYVCEDCDEKGGG